jgi:hypothetical protein
MITPSFSLTATERVLPRLALDFTTASLDSRITFTRADATATRINSSGYVETVAADTPRFDYDPVTLACKGLLIEESRVNLMDNSDVSTWTTVNTSVLSSTETSPANDSTASLVTASATTGRFIKALTFSTSGTKSVSVFMKKGTSTRSRIGFRDTTANATVALGDITWSASGPTVQVITGTGIAHAPIQLPDGWYRFSFSIDNIVAANNNQVWVYPNVSQTNTNVYVWGVQAENSAFSTSYIPTAGTTVTRNADVATMTGTNFSDWWQATRGGVLVRALPSTVSGIRPLVQFDDTTANEIISLRGNTTNPELYIVDGGTPQAQIDAGTIATNTPYSLTGWWQENNSFAQLNTQASVRDNTVTIPTVTQARIGSDGTNYLNGTIAAIYYYDELANSIYDSLRLLGYTGTVTDMLLQYYLARGATSNSLTDAEIEFLNVKGFTTGTIDDRWANYLISLGYFGTITDMKYQYWKSPE